MERMKLEREETERKRLENMGQDEEVVSDEDSTKDLKIAGTASRPLTRTRELNVAEKKRKERQILVDNERKELYGEEEVKRLENQRVEAFLNHSLNS